MAHSDIPRRSAAAWRVQAYCDSSRTNWTSAPDHHEHAEDREDDRAGVALDAERPERRDRLVPFVESEGVEHRLTPFPRVSTRVGVLPFVTVR